MRSHPLSLKAGVWSTVGGVLGSSVAPLIAPSLSTAAIAQLGIAGAVGGMALDSTQGMITSAVSRSTAGYRAILDKLRSDFDIGPLKSWSDIARNHAYVSQRLLRSGLVTTADPRLARADTIDRLKRYLAFSHCWDGRPRADSVHLLQTIGPIAVNTTSHNAAVQAALLVMEQVFGVPLHIDGKYWHGVEQVDAINQGAYADFAIIVDPNVFLPSKGKMAQEFYFMLPCGWQRHKMVRRRNARGYDHTRVWFASGTSAEEQTLLNEDIDLLGGGRMSNQAAALDISDLVGRIEELAPSDVVIAWDPLPLLHNISGKNFVIRDTAYRFSTSLYGHKTFATRSGFKIANAFQDCFIAAWNLARIYRLEFSIRLAFETDCHSNFERIRTMTRPDNLS